MKAEHIIIFLNSTINIFKEMTSVNLEVKNKTIKNVPVTTEEVGVIIGITGDLEGNIILNLSEKCCCSIAQNMSGIEFKEYNELVESAISELLNITMGKSCSVLEQQGLKVDITSPLTIRGIDVKLSVKYSPLISLQFICENESIDLDLSVRAK